jgi:hypothetical protein
MTSTVEMPAYADAAIRLRRTLSTIELDCQCRTKLDDALDRFSALEGRRQLRSGLREARHRRVMIADQVSFLDDIDEITEDETDLTVFEEMALLFDEVANQAVKAAQALRQIEASFIEDANSRKP